MPTDGITDHSLCDMIKWEAEAARRTQYCADRNAAFLAFKDAEGELYMATNVLKGARTERDYTRERMSTLTKDVHECLKRETEFASALIAESNRILESIQLSDIPAIP